MTIALLLLAAYCVFAWGFGFYGACVDRDFPADTRIERLLWFLTAPLWVAPVGVTAAWDWLTA